MFGSGGRFLLAQQEILVFPMFSKGFGKVRDALARVSAPSGVEIPSKVLEFLSHAYCISLVPMSMACLSHSRI